MAESSSPGSGGPGFLSMLAILFIALRLTGHIDWPWWLVLAPVWAMLAIYLAYFVVLVVAVIIDHRRG